MAGRRAALVPVQGAYRLRARSASEKAFPPGFKLDPRGANIAIQIDGKPFTEYRTDVGAKPFLFPVIGPTGEFVHPGVPDGKVGRRGP